MRYKVLLLMVLMLSVGAIYAQSSEKIYRVHFQSDEYVLDQSDQKLLDELLQKMESTVYSELVLKAHTDKDASATYNMGLSNKRALSVKEYLVAKGLNEKRISFFVYGENKPLQSNATQEGKAENRRVDVLVHTYPFSSLSEMLKLIGGNPYQTFKIKPNEPTTITAKNGLKIKLPAGVLETEDGKPIDKSEVQMEVGEFYKPGDFATQQLGTTAEGKMLESGGMFSVKVFQDKKELQLKDGKSLVVELPSANLQNNMQIFLPALNAAGITEWKNSSQPFELKPKKEIVLPHTNINSEKLQSYKVATDNKEMLKLEYLYKPLAYPKRAMPPKKPKELKLASKNELYSWYERVWYSKHYMEKGVEKENQRRQTNYNKLVDRYQNKVKQYELALQKYQQDSASFETTELSAFRAWLDEREATFIKAKYAIEKVNFNKAIDKISEINEQDKITSLNPKGLFISLGRPNKSQMLLLGNFEYCLNRIKQLRELSLINALGWKGNKQGQIFIGATERERQFLYRNFVVNTFANEKFKSDEGFATIFDDAQLDIMRKREKMGLLNKNDIGQIYSASLNQFGLVNCDRFNTTPPNQMAEIKVEYNGEARVSFFIPDINSFVYAYHDKKKGYYLSLPIGKVAKMVVLGFNKKGEPVYESRTVSINGDETFAALPAETSVFEIRKALASL